MKNQCCSSKWTTKKTTTNNHYWTIINLAAVTLALFFVTLQVAQVVFATSSSSSSSHNKNKKKISNTNDNKDKISMTELDHIDKKSKIEVLVDGSTVSKEDEKMTDADKKKVSLNFEPLVKHHSHYGDHTENWTKTSWRSKVVSQGPTYEDPVELEKALDTLSGFAPLVFAGEIQALHNNLARACHGQAFLLMGGDCAESFKEFNVDKVRDSFRVILQMALVLTFGGAMPVIKVGRMAGQFAKPRSEPDEVKDGVSLPSYRGDIINSEEFTPEARRHNPFNMVAAYHQSSQTLNILRAFSSGGYADIHRLHAWNLDFVEQTEEGSRYRKFATKVDESLRFMQAIGVNTSTPEFSKTDFYVAHECLLLPYEESLTRQDSISGRQFGLSGHMLWIGERTRQLDGAHLEYVRGIGNPIGVKISDKCTPEELIRIIETMNPQNEPGRLTIIVRMGAEKLRQHLPKLIEAVKSNTKHVLWVSDPVHGNTFKTASGIKTRNFEKIRDELRAFFDVHDEMGTHPGGVHLELTGSDVTECTGGLSGVTEEDLVERYDTTCDPRLNGAQALELAFLVAERLRKRSGLPPLE